MRLASYNVENLFNRAKAMNLGSWAEGKPILDKFAKANALLGEHVYTAATKRRLVDLLLALGLAKSDTGPLVVLRQNRGGANWCSRATAPNTHWPCHRAKPCW